MIPDGIVDSEWPRVERRIVDMAVVFDRWQTNLGELTLGLTADGKYAATVGGVTLSIPRQVGKTFTVGVLLVALCIEFPGLIVLWTAHHGRTTTKTFRSIQAIVKRKRVFPHIAPNGIRTANGEQEIRFANGSMIMFGAREHGFGRGMDAVDIIVFDEAQILGEKALEDMVAATNQARHEHGALLFYMGTPPRENDNGEAFENKRRKALSGRAKNMVYVECSADEDADPDDRKQWAKANPSFPHHTPVEAMERMRENLPSVESWRLEAFGIWPKPDERKSVIDLAKWATLRVEAAPPTRACLVLDVSPDRRSASIGVAAAGPDGKTLVLTHSAAGSSWVVPEVVRLKSRHEITEVALHPSSQAGSLIPDLVAAGVEFESLTTQELGQACASWQEGVKDARLAHVGQPELDAATANARTRFVGESELWDRRDRKIDISPLVAASAAAFRWGKDEGGSVYDGRDMVIL